MISAFPTHNLLVLTGAGENWRKTIEVLPEDVLLEIFDFYRLDAMEESEGRPWKWHRLAHVSRKWRHVVFGSPRRLGLRILCEYGAPIGSILASWPTLPLVAKFIANCKSKRIPRNVMVALRRPDRLCEIDLHVTSSMLAPIIEATQKPCQKLESIRITVQVFIGPSIQVGKAFLGGSAPHLREIKLDGIAFPFPSIQQVLLSTNNLVELYLAKIPNDAYFSPNDLVTGLSTAVQLKRLTVDFHSTASSLPPNITRPPPRRTTPLPSLMFLEFNGATAYIEEFVARIDLPASCKLAIRLFNDNLFEIPQLFKLIARLNVLNSPAWALVRHTVDFVGVLFFQEGRPLIENCFLGTSCRWLDQQLSFVARILNQLSPLLSNAHSLGIQDDYSLLSGQLVTSTRWLEVLRPFTHVTQVYVRATHLLLGIARALVAEDMTAEVLPELALLHLKGYRNSLAAERAAELFVARRKASGRTVSLFH